MGGVMPTTLDWQPLESGPTPIRDWSSRHVSLSRFLKAFMAALSSCLVCAGSLGAGSFADGSEADTKKLLAMARDSKENRDKLKLSWLFYSYWTIITCPGNDKMSFAILTREQSRRLDQLAIEEYGMTGLVLMENAGRGATDVLCRERIDGPVLICCGKGNNAGDGFVMARHLDLRGYLARVLLWSDPDELQGDAAANFDILRKTDVPVTVFARGFAENEEHRRLFDDELAGAAWVVDALLGTGARGEPRPPIDAVIERINAAHKRVLAVDMPSGLDCDTGRPAEHTIRARVCCTFAAAKPGLLVPEAERFVGRLHVLDIGAPRRLVEQMNTTGKTQ